MRNIIIDIALFLFISFSFYGIARFGAKGNSTSLSTKAIQRAVDKARKRNVGSGKGLDFRISNFICTSEVKVINEVG